MLARDYDLAVIGRAVGDPARAAMLLRLMDGCGHSARDLATAAGVSASGSRQFSSLLDGSRADVPRKCPGPAMP